MPGFNKTGPLGRGSMTGRRMGNCVGNEGSDNIAYGRGGRGYGRGAGFGNKFGFGFGRNRQITTNVSEKTVIENEINTLKDQLSSLKKQLDDLTSED